ncbi:hypothetical protein HYD48_00690 [Mycoplasmopsis bovis]|nr:hypothetical protein [Mycoplasmopsis bovis]QQH77678.1 hypothetical protein HYD48_00690 [Mycoplasmopsis bovis]
MNRHKTENKTTKEIQKKNQKNQKETKENKPKKNKINTQLTKNQVLDTKAFNQD